MSKSIHGLDRKNFEIYTGPNKPKITFLKIIRTIILVIIVLIISVGGTYTYLEFNKINDSKVETETSSNIDKNRDINLNNNNNTIDEEITRADSLIDDEKEPTPEPDPCDDLTTYPLGKASKWWNEDFEYSQKLKISHNDLFDKNKLVKLIFNHKKLVLDNKSKSDGSDIRMVMKVNNNSLQIPFELVDPNTVSAEIIFPLNQEYENTNYFLYYGNNNAESKSTEVLGLLNEQLFYSISLLEKEEYPLEIMTNKLWLLKNYREDPLNISVKIKEEVLDKSNLKVSYEIENTNFIQNIVPQAGEYETEVYVDNLQSGQYNIKAFINDGCHTIKSSSRPIIVSQPLFVTWTMDWEGLDASDYFLGRMDKIANRYEIPISHYFNPRIYIGLSNSRAQYLTDWVKERARTRGDSIDLHLHMFYDMARAAGVNPTQTEYTDSNGNVVRREIRPRWGSPNTEGYDVIMTSYTYEETKKVLDWGLKQFEKNGLPRPKGFRAGGWYLDLDNMKALESMNFQFDSSGRTSFIWGSNRLTNPWNLSSTSQPYYPSKQNQNSSNPAPNFDVLQFPNNGADSYTFSGTDMINRFKANYSSGTFLEEKKIVTYLSHPHWFSIDEPKLNLLFNHINNYLYKNDNGPVVYIDMDDAYRYWAE